MLTFLNPLLLLALFSAAIPLILHLSRSRRTKTMRFSTTRFLSDQFLRSYRMSRLKELGLLAARMALCALFALALAQPLIRPAKGLLQTGQSRLVVIILDDSASMGHLEGGQSVFERARIAALDMLDSLQSGDTASLVLAGRRAAGPETVFSEPTAELADVRQAIQSARVTALTGDLSGAVGRAEELARAAKASSKEVVLFSDLQTSNWTAPDETAESGASPGDLLHLIVDVGAKEPSNVAVTAVEFATARPMVGVPFTFRPHVYNQSDVDQACEIELYIDGKKVGQQPIERLTPRRWSVARFHHAFTSGGWHQGYVQVKDARLDADNRRYFAFEVLGQIRVLAVNGAQSEVARLDELFFLRAALAAASGGESSIIVETVAPGKLASESLDGVKLVVLANAASLPDPAVEKLEQWVDRGGSLLIFLGDQVNSRFYNETLANPNRIHQGLLPARLAGMEGDPTNERPIATVGEIDAAHPALATLAESESSVFAGIHFHALWTLEPRDAAVPMRATGGMPLLCEKSFGQGRSLLFAAPCDRDWSNFPTRPAYLPWMYRLVSYLAQDPLARQTFHTTGASIALPVSVTNGLSQLLVKTPEGAIETLSPSLNSASRLVFETAHVPGVYSVFPSRNESQSRLFAVNVESVESDLACMGDREDPAMELTEMLPRRESLVYISDPAQVVEESLAARRGVRLWDVLLIGALGLALFEPWLANRISRERSLRPGASPSEIAASMLRTGRPRPASATAEALR